MKFTRFVRTTEARPDALVPEGDSFGLASRAQSLRELPDGSFLLRCEFPSDQALAAAQGLAGVTVLPSLQTPAERLPQAVKDWLAAHGVTLEPGDTLLNLIRKLRAATSRGAGDFFDVTLPE